MGNCCGRDQNKYEPHGTSTGIGLPGSKAQTSRDKQAQTWRQTGIIGLRDRGIKEIPNEVYNVGADAKVLDCANNKIVALGEQLCQLVNLQRLVLSGNLITSLPGDVCAAMSSTLKILILDGNSLTLLPDEVGRLSRLEKLSVQSNRLKKLTPSIGRCTVLSILIVSKNQLTDLPDELGSCDALEELDASGNAITDIPAALGQLQKLKTLNMDNNKITKVPPAVFLNCMSLQTLALHGNPVNPEAVQETEGFQAFETRRQQKYNKVIAGGVLLGSRGMDEGMDRKLKNSP
mmetsp:Transcript_5339/g.11678  ORF Transcript_5339/g.11678 Transcript_5339/m.11678 type:complete len:290 (-) Transcript_5339:889-1758(-)